MLLGEVAPTFELLCAAVPEPLPPPPLPVPPPPCSEAPLSLPQLSVYHVPMAVLSLGSLQEVAHMVVRAPLEADQTFLQKHAHVLTSALDVPPHCCWAWVRTAQDEPHDGRLPLPCWSSCADAAEARRAERRSRAFVRGIFMVAEATDEASKVWICVNS